MKRKTQPKQPKASIPGEDKTTPEDQEIKLVEPVKVEVKKVYRVKSNWSGTLVISEKDTPSGLRYTFSPHEEQPVNQMDYEYLLNLERGGPGCCSGSGSTLNYFEAVKGE